MNSAKQCSTVLLSPRSNACREKKKKVKTQNSKRGFQPNPNPALEVPFFSLDSLATDTNNFPSNNKLVEGGFGLVYGVNLYNNFIKTIEKAIIIIFYINKFCLQM